MTVRPTSNRELSVANALLLAAASAFVFGVFAPMLTLNEHILVAGQATSDNLAPNISQMQYSCRAYFVTSHGSETV